MRANVETALAAIMSEDAGLAGLALCAPQFAAGDLPDTGSALVVSAEIEHRAGPVYVADVTFRLSTANEGEDSAEAHAEYEAALKQAAQGISAVDSGLGFTLSGTPYFLGQSGGVDGNRWASEIRVRFGLLESV